MARTGASLALLLMFACHMGAQLLYLWARATVCMLTHRTSFVNLARFLKR